MLARGAILGRWMDRAKRLLSYNCILNSTKTCRAIEEAFLARGAKIGYWRGEVKGVMEDLAALKPTLFFGVPHVFAKVLNLIKPSRCLTSSSANLCCLCRF